MLKEIFKKQCFFKIHKIYLDVRCFLFESIPLVIELKTLKMSILKLQKFLNENKNDFITYHLFSLLLSLSLSIFFELFYLILLFFSEFFYFFFFRSLSIYTLVDTRYMRLFLICANNLPVLIPVFYA